MRERGRKDGQGGWDEVDVCREERSKDGGKRKRGELRSVPTLYHCLIPPRLLTLVFLRGW